MELLERVLSFKFSKLLTKKRRKKFEVDEINKFLDDWQNFKIYCCLSVQWNWLIPLGRQEKLLTEKW